MTNDYFTLLANEKWQWRKWNGPKQYEDSKTKVRGRIVLFFNIPDQPIPRHQSLMMLP